MAKVTLPDGCLGLDMADGTRYNPSGPARKVELSPDHARAIRRSWYGQSGVMGGEQFALGTRRGRYCGRCRRTWNAWNVECPRCGAATVDEQEVAG